MTFEVIGESRPWYGHAQSDPWSYDGPTLFTVSALYKPDTNADAVLKAMDAEIAEVVAKGVDASTLKRLKTTLLADWHNDLEQLMSRADAIGTLQILWGDAAVVNQIPRWIEAVTSDDVKRVAATYLTHANRTVIDRKPAMTKAAARTANEK